MESWRGWKTQRCCWDNDNDDGDNSAIDASFVDLVIFENFREVGAPPPLKYTYYTPYLTPTNPDLLLLYETRNY